MKITKVSNQAYYDRNHLLTFRNKDLELFKEAYLHHFTDEIQAPWSNNGTRQKIAHNNLANFPIQGNEGKAIVTFVNAEHIDHYKINALDEHKPVVPNMKRQYHQWQQKR